MVQRVLALAVLAGLLWTVPLLAQAPAGTATYRVTIVLYPGDDAAAVARRLAAMYRGTLETPVDGNGSFTISLSEAGAGLLRQDPMVTGMDALSLAPPVPPSVPSGNAAMPAAPRMVQANAMTNWSLGPYRYDGSGNIRAIGSDFYVYDKLGRVVVSADVPPSMPIVHKQTYTYDFYGNRSSINTAGRGLTTFAMTGMSNRLFTVSDGAVSAPVGYDSAGNFVSYLGATYEYDALNVLRKSVAGGVTRSYVYTANDERIGTIEQTGSGIRSDWTIRDSAGRVLRRFSKESDGEWKWQEDYIYRGSQVLAAEVPDAAKTRHFHLDHLGTPRLITGNGGAEISRHAYHPFGEEIAPGATAREKKQFTGHERDSESLDYMHARFYAPFMGRFLSVDPVLDLKRSTSEPQSWNRYSYVVNNPINRIDPDGRMDGNGMGEPAEWRCPGCTRAEQLEQSNQIAKGTAVGAAVSLAIMAGPSGWRALGAAAINWIRGNPGAVQNITHAVEALASPAGPGASPGLPQIAKQLATAERIGTALKADPTHRAASLGLDAVATAGQSFSLKGGDGVTRTLIQAPGGMNGKAGTFEYIVNKAGQVTHQRFIEGGVVTGLPNQKPPM